MTSSRRHEPPYDTHHEVVINRAKFDACTSSSFTGVKADRHTNRQIKLRFTYSIRFFCLNLLDIASCTYRSISKSKHFLLNLRISSTVFHGKISPALKFSTDLDCYKDSTALHKMFISARVFFIFSKIFSTRQKYILCKPNLSTLILNHKNFRVINYHHYATNQSVFILLLSPNSHQISAASYTSTCFRILS